MAASFVLAVATRNDICNKLNDDLDAGVIKMYSGSAPGPDEAPIGTLLVTLNLPAKTSNVVDAGVLTFGDIDPENAVATDVAGYFRLLKTDGTTVVAEGNVGTSGATINLNTTSIVSGGPVDITALSITAPAGS